MDEGCMHLILLQLLIYNIHTYSYFLKHIYSHTHAHNINTTNTHSTSRYSGTIRRQTSWSHSATSRAPQPLTIPSDSSPIYRKDSKLQTRYYNWICHANWLHSIIVYQRANITIRDTRSYHWGCYIWLFIIVQQLYCCKLTSINVTD